APPRRHRLPSRTHRAGVFREHGRRVGHATALQILIAQLGPAHLFDIGEDFLVEQRTELDEVAVGVDDRVRETGADLRRARASHATTPSSRAQSSSFRAVATCAMWTSWPSPWFASPWMTRDPA